MRQIGRQQKGFSQAFFPAIKTLISNDYYPSKAIFFEILAQKKQVFLELDY